MFNGRLPLDKDPVLYQPSYNRRSAKLFLKPDFHSCISFDAGENLRHRKIENKWNLNFFHLVSDNVESVCNLPYLMLVEGRVLRCNNFCLNIFQGLKFCHRRAKCVSRNPALCGPMCLERL